MVQTPGGMGPGNTGHPGHPGPGVSGQATGHSGHMVSPMSSVPLLPNGGSNTEDKHPVQQL